MPIYRGFQLLADAGDEVLHVTSDADGGVAYNQSATPLTVMATRNSTTNGLHIFLSNFAPDDGKSSDDMRSGEVRENNACSSMLPHPCTDDTCYLPDTDFTGGDLLPESQKFRTPNASACCEACVNFKVDKFCQAWSWRANGTDPHRCYLKNTDAAQKAHRSKGLIGGYPNGDPPPPTTGHSWYNKSVTVRLTLKGAGVRDLGAGAIATVRMINSTCANPKAMWLTSMNSVTWPNEAQLETLRDASRVCEEQLTLVAAVGAPNSDDAIVEVTLEAYAAAEVIVPGPTGL